MSRIEIEIYYLMDRSKNLGEEWEMKVWRTLFIVYKNIFRARGSLRGFGQRESFFHRPFRQALRRSFVNSYIYVNKCFPDPYPAIAATRQNKMQETDSTSSFALTASISRPLVDTYNGDTNQPSVRPGEKSPQLPVPSEYEVSDSTQWFESTYIRRVHLESFLQLAVKARGDPDRCCRFGDRRMGGLNVAITLRFDDGVEWIMKTPKLINNASKERLESEAATLLFLHTVGSLPAPRLHAYSITAENSAKTPYIIMDKLPGITLGEAIYYGLERDGVYRAIEQLAMFRKTLQQHPFSTTGSLFPLETEDYFRAESKVDEHTQTNPYFLARLNNIWNARLDPRRYRRYTGVDSAGYYIDQHDLSLTSEPIYGTTEEMTLKSLIHFHLGLVLPSYIVDSKNYYLAHTDLSISNLLVDPSTGNLLGVIDWEFANSLPPQAVEHYPGFLANRDLFVQRYEGFYQSPSTELDAWRAHYDKQFADLPETVEFNKRIDAIFNFEHLLRYPNERTLDKIADALEALQSANALTEPLPDLPWLSHLRRNTSSNPANINTTRVTPPYSPSTPPATPPSPSNLPVTPTRNSSTPPRSSPLRNEIRTKDSHTTEEETDPAAEGFEIGMTHPFPHDKPNELRSSIFKRKPRIRSVSSDISSAETNSTEPESEPLRSGTPSSVGSFDSANIAASLDTDHDGIPYVVDSMGKVTPLSDISGWAKDFIEEGCPSCSQKKTTRPTSSVSMQLSDSECGSGEKGSMGETVNERFFAAVGVPSSKFSVVVIKCLKEGKGGNADHLVFFE